MALNQERRAPSWRFNQSDEVQLKYVDPDAWREHLTTLVMDLGVGGDHVPLSGVT